jgi:hypothetical protein
VAAQDLPDLVIRDVAQGLGHQGPGPGGVARRLFGSIPRERSSRAPSREAFGRAPVYTAPFRQTVPVGPSGQSGEFALSGN